MDQLLTSDFSDVTLPPLPDVRGMISGSERRFYYHLTTDVHTGEGQVVEIGTWLGCSTLHLAAGLRDGGRKVGGQVAKVHAFDDYTWRPGMEVKTNIDLAFGESFMPFFLQNTAPLAAHITANAASAAKLGWPRDATGTEDRIEILVVDAPKSWKGMRLLFQQLSPYFIPGKTIVTLQDYLLFGSFEIAMFAASVAWLTPVWVTREGCSVAFRVGVDATALDDSAARTYRGMTADQIVALWDRILRPLPPEASRKLAPALPLVLWDMGFRDIAEDRAKVMEMDAKSVSYILSKTKKKEQDAAFAWIRAKLRENMHRI